MLRSFAGECFGPDSWTRELTGAEKGCKWNQDGEGAEEISEEAKERRSGVVVKADRCYDGYESCPVHPSWTGSNTSLHVMIFFSLTILFLLEL